MSRPPFFRADAVRLGRGGKAARKGPGSRKGPQRARLAVDELEDRRMLSVTTPVETIYRDLVSVAVVDRRLFYNNSAFDNNNPAANANDDDAIASDKSALLPGGSATFSNYTSYSRGINGLVIDVAGLPTATLSAADFTFRVGNSNVPATWTTAPAPTSISVRSGEGISGSARVEILWADGAIQKQWLQVTLKATPHTGLKTDDVFYFGNAVGESGNSPADAIVNAVDEQGAHNNPANPSPVTSRYDFNRDGVVNSTDETIAAANGTSAGTALQLIAAPAVVQTPPPERLTPSLFNWGDGGYPVFNNPALVTTASGTVLAFAEGRATSQDSSSYAIVMRRSTDGGLTWSVPTQVYSVAPLTGAVISQPAPIVDKNTGEVFLLFNRGTFDGANLHLTEVFVTHTSDDGLTWTTPVDITDSVTVTEGNNPGPPGVFPDTPWGWAIVGPGHGIQLERGEHAGRLIVGGDHRDTNDNSGKSWSHVIYSDDHGATWHLGGGLVGSSDPLVQHANDGSNENSLVELSNGDIYMSIRVQREGSHFRGQSTSTDGGITWSGMLLEPDLTPYQVEGSVLRLNDNVLLFSSPNSTDKFDELRHEMTIWLSYDEGQNWSARKVVFFGYSGYSDMTVVGPDTILLSYTRGWNGLQGSADVASPAVDFYAEIGLARVNLKWLESTDPYEFDWYFNEREPGELSNGRGFAIQDYGDWDERARARASTPSVAPQYVEGVAGDSALHLTTQTGANGVLLSQGYNTALFAEPDYSFTVQIEMKTSDDTGVIIGTRPTIRNWTLQIVGGKVQFSLYDSQNTAVITSNQTVNDGQWHHIAAVRDASARLLKLYIDHVEAADAVVDTATKPYGVLEHEWVDAAYLGMFNTSATSSKLDFTVDTLRFTRAALLPQAFFSADLVVPTPPPPPSYLPNAPTAFGGLQLWLPPYDPTKYFSDFGSAAGPLPLAPFDGMATRTAIDASSHAFLVQTDNQYRQVLYAHDAVIGSYWEHRAAPGATFGSEWWIHNQSSGITENKFDFVQETGVFTLSTFLKLGASTGGYMTIFDTSEASSSLPGFSLFVQQDGRLFLTVTGGTAETVRFFDSAPAGAMAPEVWYHVAVVGNGPGNPINFYVTPASASDVAAFNSTSVLAGANGTYPTDLNHELFVGSRSNKQASGASPFNGGLVNEAIFDQALTPAQIQQLFLFGKGLTTPTPPWHNAINPVDVDANQRVQSRDALLVINRVLRNLGLPQIGPGVAPPPYYDTTGNNSLNAQDALLVINWLLRHPPQANPVTAQVAVAAEGGDPPSSAILQTASDAVATGPQITVLSASIAQDIPAPASTVVSHTATPSTAAVSDAPGATVLMIEPRYATTSRAPAVAGDSNCVDENGDAETLAADEYFRALARIDGETGDNGALVAPVSGRRTFRWAPRPPRAMA